MRTKALIFLSLVTVNLAVAQTDVTENYIQNPDFEARYAAWLDEGTTKGQAGGFQHQTNADFEGKSGEIYMEKWVGTGSKVANCTISQTIKDIPAGTYMLVCNAQNIQQNSSAQQTGAYLFAGDEQTEVNSAGEYSVTFSVVGGSVKVGFKTQSATGNWVCVDNFRLYQMEADIEALHLEIQKLIDAAEEVIGDGATAGELEAAANAAKELLTSETTDGMDAAAKTLTRATLNYQIGNGSGSVPTVVTNPFVAQGATIALGRSTITANGATIAERGFCWSTEPEPTVLDERTTEYFSNNGYVYRMEHLEPATMYYVRAYAMTSEYEVGYGDVVKIATKPKGNVTYYYGYNADDDEVNYRINSSLAEGEWMYNNIAHITDFKISCSYNSGVPTADCSYGGSMRVGPSSSYQQTGTILHETNHGVGVGTTAEWSGNATLRENTSSGKWLGPYANEMLQFLQNDEQAYMTGDDTHMWGSTTSGISMKPYGINGADEDSSNPADQLLYWGNIFLTHALHIDGLPCTASQGFASPSYVFEQRDNVKYYIKCEDNEYGLASYLGHSDSGTLQNVTSDVEEAKLNDELAWYITFNPQTQYYSFQNAGTGRYIGLSNGELVAGTSAAAFHIIPSREKRRVSDASIHSYWITLSKGAYALTAGTTDCSTTAFDNSNDATRQRWFFLTEDELASYESGVMEEEDTRLSELLANVRSTAKVEHVATDEATDVSAIDDELEEALSTIESEKGGYTTAEQFDDAITAIEEALLAFLSEVTPADVCEPFDISYLLDNAAIDDNTGWSDTPTFSYSCCEYYTKGTFDFNQTTSLRLPAGTYELRAQAFQRPGSYKDVYTDYVTNGINNVKAQLYIRTKATTIMNIYEDAQTQSQGTGSVMAATRCYIPDTMEGAQNFFTNGFYDNSVVTTTSSATAIKVGLRCSFASSTEYWTCFDNFRLYFYGGYTSDEVTPVETVAAQELQETDNIYHDLSGRAVTRPTRGLYIHNGRKILVK